MSPKKKQIEFAFRYQPEAGTPEAILLEYIRSNQVQPSREMVFQALRAFWFPFAMSDNGQLEPKAQSQLALDAVYALHSHATRICQHFGLENPFVPSQIPKSSANGRTQFMALEPTLQLPDELSSLESADYDSDCGM
jgi:hypothetical protein